MRIKTVFFILLAALLSLSHQRVHSQPSYAVQQVGADSSVSVKGVNDSGQIVGSYVVGGATRAFLYQNGTFTNLGTFGGSRSGAEAISQNSKIVGQANDANNNIHAFVSENGGPLTDLGTLGGTVGWAHAVNNQGQLAGYSWESGSTQRRAMLYSDGAMSNLGIFPGGNSSTAYGINEAGQVVGEGNAAVNGGTWIRAFLYANGAMTDIGTLGGNVAGARDINNRGEIVGYAQPAGGAAHAFRFRNGIMTDLGVLSGHLASQANAINDAGEAIGFSRASDQSQRAIIHRAARLQDLNDLIPSGTGWLLTNALGISESGLIVGTGRLNNVFGSFLLTPLYSLAPSTLTPGPGQTISVSWTAPPGSPAFDWIGLYKVGDPDAAFQWWSYTNGADSGTFDLRVPAEPGEFEFRYFYNNGFRLMEVSAPLTIVRNEVTATLTVSATTVFPGDPLSVSWTVNAGRPAADWIGLYKVGDPNRAYGWWRYTGGATSGTFELSAPREFGVYEFRYLLDNGYEHVAVSPTVTVGRAGYMLTATPSTVAPGASVTVEWSAPAGSSAHDWIGLYREGEPDNHNYLWPFWFYTNGSTSGSRTLTMPSEPGRYVLRYLLNNGYFHTVESAVIQVQ